MCTQKVTRSKAIYITLIAGQGSYQFNVNTFQRKKVTRIEVQDPTGQGVTQSPSGQTLASTADLCKSYVTLVSLKNPTDHIIDPYPTSRFMPSIGTAIGAGLPNYYPVDVSGMEALDMNNSSITWPDPTVPQFGQVVCIQVWYEDMTAAELNALGI
jgi:hypothetical protein